jgi:hypothetical protein
MKYRPPPPIVALLATLVLLAGWVGLTVSSVAQPATDPAVVAPVAVDSRAIAWDGFSGDITQPRMTDPRWRRVGAVQRDLMPMVEKAAAKGYNAFVLHTPQGCVVGEHIDAKVWSMLEPWKQRELRQHLSRWLRSRPSFEFGVYGNAPRDWAEFQAEYGPWIKLGARIVAFDDTTAARGAELARMIRASYPGTRVLVEPFPISASGAILDACRIPDVEFVALGYFLATWVPTARVPDGATLHVIVQGTDDPANAAKWASRGFIVDRWNNTIP